MVDDGMRRIRLDEGQEEGADASIPPLYMRPNPQMTVAPSSQATAAAEDETPTLPLLPPPALTTPPRRRNNSSSGNQYSSSSHRQKNNSKFRVVTTAGAASGGNSSTSASPRVAIESLVSTPGSSDSRAAIAAALGNASSSSEAMLSDVVAVAGDNSRNTAAMLSDSTWEREIAEFGRILDDMLTRVTCRDLVKKTAEFMKEHPQHSVRFQIKIKQVNVV